MATTETSMTDSCDIREDVLRVNADSDKPINLEAEPRYNQHDDDNLTENGENDKDTDLKTDPEFRQKDDGNLTVKTEDANNANDQTFEDRSHTDTERSKNDNSTGHKNHKMWTDMGLVAPEEDYRMPSNLDKIHKSFGLILYGIQGLIDVYHTNLRSNYADPIDWSTISILFYIFCYCKEGALLVTIPIVSYQYQQSHPELLHSIMVGLLLVVQLLENKCVSPLIKEMRDSYKELYDHMIKELQEREETCNYEASFNKKEKVGAIQRQARFQLHIWLVLEIVLIGAIYVLRLKYFILAPEIKQEVDHTFDVISSLIFGFIR